MLEHWVTLNMTDGVGPILSRRMIERAGSVAAACDATAAMLRTVEGIGPHKATKIADAIAVARGRARDEIGRARAKGIGFITPEDAAWPHLLTAIPDPPLVMYMSGTLEARDLNAVAIVGARKCSLYGREQAERFAQLLARAGFSVISGGARGVDSSAHRGAMSIPNGRTVAVVGSGLDVPYPPENVELFAQIAGRGAVLSEYPLGTPPVAENFPRRNRIVSGMSRGVLVIEADERSGALITARQAADEHNRVVMAIPGRVDNPQSAGPHKLIRQGATLVTRVEHIIEALGPLDASIPEMPLFESMEEDEPQRASDARPTAPPVSSPVTSSSVPSNLSEDQETILASITRDPRNVDAITEACGLEVSVVLRELTLLTLKGRVKRVDGQQYVLVR